MDIAHKISSPDDGVAAYQLVVGGCADNLLTLLSYAYDPPTDVGSYHMLVLKSF